MSSVELDETVITWAVTAFIKQAIHVDINNTPLENEDTVVLTQVLNVKVANFMAPKGTVVRKTRLVPDNTDQIEGKVNEQTIVILTKFVRKSA
jgi:protein PhnA